MHKFTKASNGHPLEIEVPKTELLAKLDHHIEDVKEILQELAELEHNQGGKLSEEALHDFYIGCYVGFDKVLGKVDVDYCSPQEILDDLEKFKQRIINITDLDNGNVDELFDLLPVKKNGTFNRKTKPIVMRAINGSFSLERYGWFTMVLRLVPLDNIHAKLELAEVVVGL